MMQPPPDTTTNPRGFGGKPDPKVETDEDGAVPATEEEQMDYDLLTVRARKMIFGKSKEKVLKMLGSSETPAQGMGQVGAMIIKALVQSSKDQGREIAPDTAIEAGAEVADDLNELAKKNNIFQYDSPKDEEKELGDAMLWGVKYYGDGMVSSGEITPELQKQAQMQVNEGLEAEGKTAPQPTPIAAGVNQAMQPPGLVGGAMGGV